MKQVCVGPLVLLLTAVGFGQTINTTCTLYPTAAYCTSTSSGASIAEAQRQQYEAGQAIGTGIGMAIFRAHFPGWRRKHCAKHPGQPFYYGNARGDSITGTCPSLQGLSNEAAAEFVGKHRQDVKSMGHAAAIDKYIANNNLPAWEPKSYEKAAKGTANGSFEAPHAEFGGSAASADPYTEFGGNTTTKLPPKSLPADFAGFDEATPRATPQDVFVWFDEPAPAPGAPLFEVIVTARAYDGALAILRQARQANTSVQAGVSVLDTDYHPSTVTLAAWQKGNSGSAPTLFFWQGEDVTGTTPVMHFQMTKRAYEQMLALIAGSELRARPSQTGNK
ncbi:MAG: hypothetical protein ABSG52_12480 [Terriglobales bacterium]|jgi:hypothetical protein